MVSKGGHLSPEHRAKISISLVGRKDSPETCLKRSLALKGKSNGRAGIPMPEETKRKISEARRGKPHPHKKGADRKPRKPFTDEQKRRLAESHRGLKRSEATKRKMSEAARGEKNQQWKGGVSFRQYCPLFNFALKEEIREAFGRKCFLCGLPESDNGRRLDVHHCDYNKGQGCGQKWSLLPLCSDCHKRTNHNRWYWFALLKDYWALDGLEFAWI